MWTQFMDMHSGGGSKEPQEYIYIEAPEDEAKTIFYKRFRHNPERVTCTCCGEDYSVTEEETLEQATAFERGCDYDRGVDRYRERPSEGFSPFEYKTLGDYLKTDILVIYAKDIKPEERVGDVPRQGYIWQD